jgi:hypothetical protein
VESVGTQLEQDTDAATNIVALPKRPTDAGAAHSHAVQFYDDDLFLAGVVAERIRATLEREEPAILIVTPPHRQLIVGRLRALHVSVEEAVRSGQLTLLDAGKTLERFMDAHLPSPAKFEAVIGGVIDASVSGRGRVSATAYGEMVDVLLASGNVAGALRLEQLWNDLARFREFSLLCAYRMSNFSRAEDVDHFRAVCAEHTHVLPAESYAPADEDHGLREISSLQQRARALDSEVAERARLEQALRSTIRSLRSS